MPCGPSARSHWLGADDVQDGAFNLFQGANQENVAWRCNCPALHLRASQLRSSRPSIPCGREAQMTSPFLQISGVTKTFDTAIALDNVSLSVGAGEFLTFLGPSGCGKTTLLRIIAGFLSADAGTISIDGVSIGNLPPNHRPVGMVFQNLALFPHLSVTENVSFGLTLGRYDRDAVRSKVADMLALVGLSGFEARLVTQLSGGQRQRVALARALVLRPKVLLLDEPLSALDLKLRRQLQIELKRLQRSTGTTFIFVTHDQEEAMAMSDRIAVFNTGRIEQIGTPSEVYKSPKTRFVAQFVGEANVFEAIGRGGTLSIPDLELDIAWPDGRALPQGPLIVSARPEHLSIDAAGSEAVSCSGTITEREYLGPFVRMTAVTANTRRSLRLLASAAEADRFQDGQSVKLYLDSARVSLLESDSVRT
jgi:putative spermidine/putrescine transport system ATP-binding protein